MDDSVDFEVGFADGQILGYQRDADCLSVMVQAWDASKIMCVFCGVIGVLDLDSAMISDLRVRRDESQLLRDALGRQYVEVPKNHSYRVYEFLDTDGGSCLQIVGEDLKVSRVGG